MKNLKSKIIGLLTATAIASLSALGINKFIDYSNSSKFTLIVKEKYKSIEQCVGGLEKLSEEYNKNHECRSFYKSCLENDSDKSKLYLQLDVPAIGDYSLHLKDDEEEYFVTYHFGGIGSDSVATEVYTTTQHVPEIAIYDVGLKGNPQSIRSLDKTSDTFNRIILSALTKVETACLNEGEKIKTYMNSVNKECEQNSDKSFLKEKAKGISPPWHKIKTDIPPSKNKQQKQLPT